MLGTIIGILVGLIIGYLLGGSMANKQRADLDAENLNLELLYHTEKQRADEAAARCTAAENDLGELMKHSPTGFSCDYCDNICNCPVNSAHDIDLCEPVWRGPCPDNADSLEAMAMEEPDND